MTTGYEQVLREREMNYELSRKKWAGRRGNVASVARGVNNLTFKPVGKLIGGIYNKGEAAVVYLTPRLFSGALALTKGIGRGLVEGAKATKGLVDSVADDYARANITERIDPETLYQYDPTKTPFQNGCAERGQRRLNARSHRKLEGMAEQLSQRGIFVTPEDIMREKEAERQYALKVEQTELLEVELLRRSTLMKDAKKRGVLTPNEVDNFNQGVDLYNTMLKNLKVKDQKRYWASWRG